MPKFDIILPPKILSNTTKLENYWKNSKKRQIQDQDQEPQGP